MSDDTKHTIRQTYDETRREIRSTCSCGDTWTHPRSRLLSERLAVDDSHMTYGQRLKSTVL